MHLFKKSVGAALTSYEIEGMQFNSIDIKLLFSLTLEIPIKKSFLFHNNLILVLTINIYSKIHLVLLNFIPILII